MPEIETARLCLRLPSSDDFEGLCALFADPDVMKYLGIEAGTIPSREETKSLLGKMIEFWAGHGFGRWTIKDKAGGEMIGLCGFRLLDGTPELFYLFAKASWGKGLATEAARACLRFGFEEVGFKRIMAATRHGNVSSIRVLAKIGMKFQKEFTHSGVNALYYVATRDEYQSDDSPYRLSSP